MKENLRRNIRQILFRRFTGNQRRSRHISTCTSNRCYVVSPTRRSSVDLSTLLRPVIHGVVRVVIGGFAGLLPNWLRGLLVVVGLLTIVLSVVVFISPGFGFLTLVFILSITFLLNGIARIVSGITGIR